MPEEKYKNVHLGGGVTKPLVVHINVIAISGILLSHHCRALVVLSIPISISVTMLWQRLSIPNNL